MYSQELPDQIQAADERMQRLYQRAGAPRTHQHGLVPETFEELQLAVEELEVAGEELRVQNDALAESQIRLKREQQRYGELFDAVPSAHFVTDTRGVVREANAAASTLVNLNPRYLLGKPLFNYVALPDRERVRRSISNLLDAHGLEIAISIAPRHSESAIPMMARIILLRDEDGQPEGIGWLMRPSDQTTPEQPISLAETLRRALLATPAHRQVSGLSIGSAYQPADTGDFVGGSYSDVFQLADRSRIALVVARLAGQGAQAALTAVQIKHALSAFLWETGSPGIALAKLNDYVRDQHLVADLEVGEDVQPAESRIVAAVTVAVVNAQTGEAVFSCAGNSSSVIIDTSGRVRDVQACGQALGALASEYPETATMLGEGDRLLMSSRGTVEPAASGEAPGQPTDQSLRAAAQEIASRLTPEAMAEALVERVQAAAKSQFSSDACVLVAQRQP